MRKTITNIGMVMLMSITAILFNGCKGKDGAPGATGPAGNANVHSGTVSVTPGSWSNPQTGEYTAAFSDPSLTNATVDGVEAFISPDGVTWLAIPQTSLLVNGDNMSYAYQNGAVTFIYLYTSAPTVTVYLKVVVIPPALRTNPNVNYKNYESLKKAFNFN